MRTVEILFYYQSLWLTNHYLGAISVPCTLTIPPRMSEPVLQKWGAAVGSYLLHCSLAGAEVCCAIYQPHQTQQMYMRKTISLSQTGVCWLLFVWFPCAGSHTKHHLPASPNWPNVQEKNNFPEPNWRMLTSLRPVLMCRVTYQAPVGILLWVQNMTRWKKKGQKGRQRKKLQQYSRIDYNNNYGHGWTSTHVGNMVKIPKLTLN